MKPPLPLFRTPPAFALALVLGQSALAETPVWPDVASEDPGPRIEIYFQAPSSFERVTLTAGDVVFRRVLVDMPPVDPNAPILGHPATPGTSDAMRALLARDWPRLQAVADATCTGPSRGMIRVFDPTGPGLIAHFRCEDATMITPLAYALILLFAAQGDLDPAAVPAHCAPLFEGPGCTLDEMLEP